VILIFRFWLILVFRSQVRENTVHHPTFPTPRSRELFFLICPGKALRADGEQTFQLTSGDGDGDGSGDGDYID